MLRRPLIAILAALVLTFSGSTLASGNPAAAATPIEAETETRQFIGYGDSAFGLELYYARVDARNQANWAGFYDCTEIDVWDVFPGTARVTWECTR